MKDLGPLKIVRLKSENIKRLEAVEITPDGSIIVIGGKNGSGKTSVLDSITMGMAGGRATCDEPIRRGAAHGDIEIDLGEPGQPAALKIEKRITKKGTRLRVLGPDGAMYPSPQKVLEEVYGTLTFDPLAFTRLDAKKQSEIVRKLAGLDFGQHDATRTRVFETRSDINRTLKDLEARLRAAPVHADAPAEELDAAVLTADLERINATNTANQDQRKATETSQQKVSQSHGEVRSAEEALLVAQHQLEKARSRYESCFSESEKRAEATEALTDGDPGPVREQIAGMTATNKRVRENAAQLELAAQVSATAAKANAATAEIERMDTERARAISEAPLPLPGLGFTSDGVTLVGLPFDQASSAEQLRASVAIGMALNPTLRVLLVRDGSLLDSNSMRLMTEMVEARGYQLWIEVASDTGEGASVVIEDGAIKGAGTKQSDLDWLADDAAAGQAPA